MLAILPVSAGFGLVSASLMIAPMHRFGFRNFVASQAMFFVGSFLILIALGVDYAFDTSNSTAIGSFSLLVAGLFFVGSKKDYTVLFYSATSAMALLVSGGLIAVTELFALPPGVPPFFPQATVDLWGALFLLGLLDLLLVSVQLYLFVHDRFMMDHWPSRER